MIISYGGQKDSMVFLTNIKYDIKYVVQHGTHAAYKTFDGKYDHQVTALKCENRVCCIYVFKPTFLVLVTINR